MTNLQAVKYFLSNLDKSVTFNGSMTKGTANFVTLKSVPFYADMGDAKGCELGYIFNKNIAISAVRKFVETNCKLKETEYSIDAIQFSVDGDEEDSTITIEATIYVY